MYCQQLNLPVKHISIFLYSCTFLDTVVVYCKSPSNNLTFRSLKFLEFYNKTSYNGFEYIYLE